ncbi:hypothetical protein [Plantactinospora sp. KBS50]|uniref:hypothetical protein n=1 Tax=Plantactinospora sp. KBS50 TaxID=2024580 RepID=UPI001E6119B0|nr:hypothetical protein [Plantactinospora sp. KBS50]
MPPYRVAALVAPAVDRVFVAAMAAARLGGGSQLVQRYGGPPAVGFLIDFRTRLAVPGRLVDESGFAALTRYHDPAECRRTLDRQIAHGMIQRVDGGFAATERGLAFLAELYDLHAEVLAAAWREHRDRVRRLAGVLDRLLEPAALAAGPAFRAVAPPHEPLGAAPELLLLNRLGVLRYHRADAHAAAWAAAGHTAESIMALEPGPEREAIELETDRRAAGPYGVLTPDERLTLLADLAALPG